MNAARAMDRGVRRMVLVWHRRSGKDKLALNLMIKKMLERKGVYYYLFPEYSQARKAIWDGIDKDGWKFLDHFPKELIQSKNDTEMKIVLKNGSVFQLVGTDKIDSIMGTNPVGCVFSEFSLQNPSAWEMIRPILRENEGWAMFIYTPRGMNHGWKILQVAKENTEWFWEILSIKDTGVMSDDEVQKEIKEGMPPQLAGQEFYCEFLEGAGAFFQKVTENVADTFSEPEPGHIYQIGVDLAKYNDWTVCTPFDLTTFKVGEQLRFNQIDWALQKSRIEAFARKYNNAKVVVDSTGIGDPIAEDLQRTGLNVESFKFTESSKRQILDNLQILLAQNKIRIPKDEGLIGELRSMQFSMTENGKINIKVPSGITDDRIMSLALAVKGGTTPIFSMKGMDFGLYSQDFN
jgi:hypothetical protein